MGTTQSLEEMEAAGGAVGPYGSSAASQLLLSSHKRPRTLSRGSSADGEAPSSRSTGKIRATSTGTTHSESSSAASKKAVPEATTEHNQPSAKNKSSPEAGSSLLVLGDEASAIVDAAAAAAAATPHEPEKGVAETKAQAKVSDSAPQALSAGESPVKSAGSAPPKVVGTEAAYKTSSNGEISASSRQRPRHPDTRPPSGAEMQRLMDKSRAMKEELEAEADKELAVVDTPHDNDVLLGRGRRCTEHPGNVLFREFVRSRRGEYNRSWKYQKQDMAAEIVRKIQSLDPPGRFLELRLLDGRWKEVTKRQALEKASQAMREKKWIKERSPWTVDAVDHPGPPADDGSADVKLDFTAAQEGLIAVGGTTTAAPPTNDATAATAAAAAATTEGSASAEEQPPVPSIVNPATDSATEGALRILSSIANPNLLTIQKEENEFRESEDPADHVQEV